MRSRQQKVESNDHGSKQHRFYLGSNEKYIIISSDFDSGNIEIVRQISQFQYRLASVNDGISTGNKVNSKSWFYFYVQGFPKNTKGKFTVSKVQTLTSIYYSKYNKCYRPVYKSGDEGQWDRIPTQAALVMREDGEMECVFQYLFKNQNQKVYFAFCYPFSYSDNKRYLDSLNDFLFIDDFYFHKEIFTRSVEGRDLHLLTITSHDHPDPNNENQSLFNELLFPERARGLRFLKPVILISARVHPGESISSYAMKGVIDFLMNKEDLRAKLLRKMFVFMIIPMINVDGVYHGYFRMDSQGRNLNRYYVKPSPQKQPAIYAIKELAMYLNKQNRLTFYFDLHAHNAKKGHFIYGNAINDFVEQVESQVFCKIISMNNKGFQYQSCNFSQKHMNAKDRNQDLTKEGCGRVVMHKLANIIHSYSVQCGIISSNKVNLLPDLQNIEFKLDGKGIILDKYEDNNNEIYKNKGDINTYFNIEMYENVGKNLLVSILDVFDKNPYNRVYNSKYKSMDMLRRMTAFQIFHQAQRFRMFQRFVFGKVKHINQLIRQVLNTKLHYKKLYNFYFVNDKELTNVVWPQNIPGLYRPKPEPQNRVKRFKSLDVQGNAYSQSFMKALMVAQPKNKNITQEQIEKAVKNDNQSSSQTEDFEETKKIQFEFLEGPAEIQSQKLIEDDGKHRQMMNSHPSKKHVSLNQIEVLREQASPQLMYTFGQAIKKFQFDKRKQNTSVRVRRLLRQDYTTGSFKQQRQNEQKSKKAESKIAAGSQAKKSIYESIKKQIKQELKKQQVRQKSVIINWDGIQIRNTNHNIIKISQTLKIQKQKLKSFILKKNDDYNIINNSRNKIQLPTLCGQLYIISTSAKVVSKKI